ncbi:Nucleophosmin [Saguinus oedipus]|uniref:Nucleophosmin n=1 Tax=Saguinus oedipus TaxID=9490 RepID=A0ABQ9U4A4_SAGOE|nr:Nucleophosmin [Saguinus oedipus]
MDMDMSPLRPQNYLFGCELKANKDYHFKMDNDENEHQSSLKTVNLGAGAKYELHIVEADTMNYEGSPIKVTLAALKVSVQPAWTVLSCEEDAESEDEEEDVKLLSISGKRSAPGGGSKFPQKKVKLADEEDNDDDDDDFDDEETEEKAPVKKIYMRHSSQKCTKVKSEWKRLKTIVNTKIKRARILQNTRKTPKTPKGPISVEDIEAKMQASIEKGGSLPKVEAKFINYVKNCFRITDQEAVQDLWQWRKSL